MPANKGAKSIEIEDTDDNEKIVENYKILDQRCDKILSKIKKRKSIKNGKK